MGELEGAAGVDAAPTYRYVADASTADGLARAAHWHAQKELVGVRIVVVTLAMGLWWVTDWWPVPLLAILCLRLWSAAALRRTRSRYRAVVPAGTEFLTVFRPATMLVRSPEMTAEVPHTSIRALRAVGEFVVLVLAEGTRNALPRALFPEEVVPEGPPGKAWRRPVKYLGLAGLVAVVVATSAFDSLRPGDDGPSYAFLDTQPGSNLPIGFDPCRPVEYVEFNVYQPPGTEGLLDSAVEEISDASGLEFVYKGPAIDPRVQKPAAEGAPREPVLIAWARPEDVEPLKSRVLGVGGSNHAWNADRGEFEYVRGIVVLDASDAQEMLKRVNGRDWVRALIMHELGHVVGLDHVDDRKQLMYPVLGKTELGLGDRAGLAAVGAGRCR